MVDMKIRPACVGASEGRQTSFIRLTHLVLRKFSKMLAEVGVPATMMELLKSDEDEDHTLRIPPQDCKKIVIEMNLLVSHTLKEGNRCADAMAKLGVNQLELLQIFHHVPLVVKDFLEADDSLLP